MMALSEKQKEILNYNNYHRPRLTVLEGSVRSGKTTMNNLLWILHVSEFSHGKSPKKFIMTGNTLASLKRNVLDELTENFGIPTKLNSANEFTLFGNTMVCFGSNDSSRYKSVTGFTAYGWYANEVGLHHENTVKQAMARCSGKNARIFWDTNPSSPRHFIKRDYIDHSGETLSDGRIAIKSWHFQLSDNPYLDRDYVENLEMNTPKGVWYERNILGLWVSAEGAVYRDFDQCRYVIDSPPSPLVETIAGVDWGYRHYGVILVFGVDRERNYYLLEEIAEKNKSLDWWVQAAIGMTKRYPALCFYCDSARPDYIAEFKNRGLMAKEADKAVIEGISTVAGLIKNQRLYIVRGVGELLLKEIVEYRWQNNDQKEAPVKADDDALDAMRYALYSHRNHNPNQSPDIGIWEEDVRF